MDSIQVGNRYSVPSLNNITVEAESVFKETGQVLVRNVVTSERQVVFVSNLRPEHKKNEDPFESPMPEAPAAVQQLPVEKAARAIDRIVDALATMHTSENAAERETAKQEIKHLSVAQLQTLLHTDIDLNKAEREGTVSSEIFFYARVAAQQRRDFLQGYEEAKNILRQLKHEYNVSIVDEMRQIIQNAGEAADDARLERRRKHFFKALALYCGDPGRVRETMPNIGIAVDFVTRNHFNPLDTMWILRSENQDTAWSSIKETIYRQLKRISQRETTPLLPLPLLQQYQTSTATVSLGGWHESSVSTHLVMGIDRLRPIALLSNYIPKEYDYLLKFDIPRKLRLEDDAQIKMQYPTFMDKNVYKGMKYVDTTTSHYDDHRFFSERNSRYVLLHPANVEAVWFEKLEIQSDNDPNAILNLLPLHARGMTKLERSGNYISLESHILIDTLYTEKTREKMGTVLISTATADDPRFLVTVAVYHEPKRRGEPERWSLIGVYIYRAADQMDLESALKRGRMGACLSCGQDNALMQCSHCDKAIYCDQQCADTHWEEHSLQ